MDMKEPYDYEVYAEAFFPMAAKLTDAAVKAETQGEKEKAAEFFLRASALYRIARFPIPRTNKQRQAWTNGKDVFMRAQALLPHGVTEVNIPHTHGLANEGKVIEAYTRFPTDASLSNPVATVVMFSGLDGYRTDLIVFAEAFYMHNIGVIVIDIPGTGDSPADPRDPKSPDRQASSLLDWCEAQPYIDSKRLCVWGLSTGGYYAARVAYTHASRLKGAVCHGGGTHHMFDKEWLDEVNHLENPFDLAGALAWKFGYGWDLAKFKDEASKFSMLRDGTLEEPSTRLLLINGTNDTIFPVDDQYLALRTGPKPKEARFVEGKGHMAEPGGSRFIFDWIFDLFGLERHDGEVDDAVKSIMTHTKHKL